jgi:hydrogenase/urease accessory protein HupE
MVAALFWLILGVTCALPAWAHTPALSVLAMKEVSPGVFVTSWEHTHGIDDVSAAYDLIRPVFPEHCRFEVPHVHCGTRGLTGRIGFDGLGALSASGMIKIAWADGSTRVLNVTTMQPHVRVTETRHGASTYRDAVTFVGTGVTHIWLGLDHLLFVFGLLWLVDSWRLLVKTITAFTIAHSVTLGAATLGIHILPAAPVEAVIALSIAFVAVEIAREARTRQPSFTRRSPWLVAFGFGLLHGLGFANALAELEVPTTKLPLALLGFNVGVEIGQLAFVAALVALRPAFRSLERTAGAPLRAPGYYAMGALAMYWFFERVVAFTPNLGQPA